MYGPVNGTAAADTDAMVKKMEHIITGYNKRKESDGTIQNVNFKVRSVVSDSASVMVAAKQEVARKHKLFHLACKFHSDTDLASGQVIDDGIPWIKSAVADASLLAKFVKGRSRVLAAFNKLRQAKNKTIAEEKKGAKRRL